MHNMSPVRRSLEAFGKRLQAAAEKWAAAETRVSAMAYEPRPLKDGELCGWGDNPTHIELVAAASEYRVRRTVLAVLGAVTQEEPPESMLLLFSSDEGFLGTDAKEALEAAKRGLTVYCTIIPKDWDGGTARDWRQYEIEAKRSFGRRVLLPNGCMIKLLSAHEE